MNDSVGPSELRVIAIDGPAGSGKSTVARRLAERLGLEYLDTGAMYRAVTFAALRRNVDPSDGADVGQLAARLEMSVDTSAVIVDDVDATIEIRGPEVTRAVSIVAANPDVRREMVRRQQEWARARGGGVIEGRDIGTVVFPDAELKVYLTARPEVRAARRSQRGDRPRLRDGRRRHRPARRPRPGPGGQPARGGGRRPDRRHQRPRRRRDRRGAGGEAGVSDDEREVTRNERRVEITNLQPPTRFERILYAVLSGALWGLCRLYFRPEVIGREHVPIDRPFILCPVHRSYIDFALTLACHRPRMRYLAKDTLWKEPVGRLWSKLGAIPVARGVADREALKACIAVLEQGEPLVMFPEGTRQEGPVVEHLFDGPAYVQSRTGAPIVPVGIGGSAEAMPRGSTVPRPRKVRIVIGEPLEAPEVEGAKARRGAVKAQTEALHDEVQRLYDEAERR